MEKYDEHVSPNTFSFTIVSFSNCKVLMLLQHIVTLQSPVVVFFKEIIISCSVRCIIFFLHLVVCACLRLERVTLVKILFKCMCVMQPDLKIG